MAIKKKASAARAKPALAKIAPARADKKAMVKTAQAKLSSGHGKALAPKREAPKTKTAAKMATKTLAKPVEKAKSAPAKSVASKTVAAKTVAAKTVLRAPALKTAAAKPAVKATASKPAAKPVATKPVAGKPVAGKPVAKAVAPAKSAAAIKPAAAPTVNAKSAAEKLASMRASIAAKAEGRAKAAAAPVAPPAPPAPSLTLAPKPYIPGAPRSGPSFSAGRPGFPPGSAPITKPMPKPQGGKHFGFKALEYVVYPAHGVGQIIAIEEQQVAGYSLELFVVNFAKDKLTLKVPAPKVAQGAIRKLADAALVQKSLDCLTGRARIKRTMWSRRAQEYEAKINSGDLIAIAEVVRDLFRSEAQPEQSYSERQLYEAALDRMAREIAAVQRLTDTEALKVLDGQLRKGPRRGIKVEGVSEAEADVVEGDIEQAA